MKPGTSQDPIVTPNADPTPAPIAPSTKFGVFKVPTGTSAAPNVLADIVQKGAETLAARDKGVVVAAPPVPSVATAPIPVEPETTADGPQSEDIMAAISSMLPPPASNTAAAAAEEPAEPEESRDAGESAPQETQNDPKAGNAWAVLKRKIKAAEQRAQQAELERDEARASVETLKAKPMEIEEIAALKKKVAEYEDRMGQLDVTMSPAFQERYDAPMRQTFGRIASLLQRSGRTPEQALEMATKIAAANGDLNKIQELVAEADIAMPVQAAIVQNADQLTEMVRQRDAAVQHWRETKPLLQDAAGREATARSVQDVVVQTDKAVEALVAGGNWLLSENDDNPDWNKQRDDIVRSARLVLRENRPEEVAKYVMAGLTADRYREWGLAQFQRAEAMAAEMAKRSKVRPNLGATVVDEPPAPPAKPAAVNPQQFLDTMLTRVDPSSLRR